MDVAEGGGELDDVVPDDGLWQEPGGGQCVGLLPQQIVLGLGIGSGAFTVEWIDKWRYGKCNIIIVFNLESLNQKLFHHHSDCYI